MNWSAIILTILGLCLFETISSIDNAIINADVLATMRPRARRWFLVWGLFIAVFVVRGFLPWLIVWAVNPALGFIGSFTAAFSSDTSVMTSLQAGAPVLLVGGGIFLVFLFLHWLFLEEKNFGFHRTEEFFMRQGVWFYATASIFLAVIVWKGFEIGDMVAFGAVIGSAVFFITNGFKLNAEDNERRLLNKEENGLSDWSKILFLEVIDATFSIDGVIGAFAFTLSVPLILIGNGLGAFIVRQLTVGNVERIKKYVYLKNGAMYSIFFLGLVMILDAFGFHLPEWVSPLVTFLTVGYFFIKSKQALL